MKKVLFGFGLLVSALAFSQDVKMKDGFVIINKEKCFKYTSKSMSFYNNFYDLNDKKLFYIDGAKTKSDETYFKIQFTGSDEIITLPATAMNFRKGFLENLIEEGVINASNCTINLENIKMFKDRYNKDYNTTETTVIINNQSNNTTPRNGVNISIGR
ncbi:hypothetical protein [Chryseobacterium gambrini]|uniref:hypothetical protein n=1 Tax=Chryseobacterium gambrini TaxID=373672 RepID=UPI0022F3DBDD|nr:hypothetical protein [Chryseobacterium gambrini]WBX97475.1 hypothetical protein PE065_21905 [Chryseobacterium gambrini]